MESIPLQEDSTEQYQIASGSPLIKRKNADVKDASERK
jgi:hypothetical protein